MKKMSLLGPKLTELREKFADEPQKLNMEMMQLYRRYGVNPMGGCIPVLFQMPIFFGFYRMLMAAAELRGEKFAWVKDLSLPDTQFEIAGLPINPMPILMAVTMVIQMAVTPQTGDKTQRIIFMLMPVMFLFICYNFASALALYWTTTNIFSIFQTWLMRLQPEPELIDKNQQAKEQKQAEKKQKKGSRPSMGGGSGQKSRKK